MTRAMDGRDARGQWLRIVRRLTMAGAIVATVVAGQGRTEAPRVEALAPVAVNCDVTFSSPLFVAGTGQLSDIRIDDACRYVYGTNPTMNRVEVFDLQSQRLLAPVQVGSIPSSLDITPDGTTMYVTNSGGSNISVVDVATRQELRKITILSDPIYTDRPYSIAIANNGKAFLSTTFSGSGFGARMLQLDLATDVTSRRLDFWFNGTTTEVTSLKASGDRSKIGIVAGDISSGPVFAYNAGTDTFTPEHDTAHFVYYVATNTTGSVFLVDPGTYVLDAGLNLSGTIPSGGYGVAVSPSGALGYRTGAQVDILNLSSFLKVGGLTLGDTGGLKMAISADGSLVAVAAEHGISLLKTDACGASGVGFADADGDGQADCFELAHSCLDVHMDDAAGDADGDGLPNLQESLLATDPCVVDSDRDGCADSEEAGTNKQHGGDRNALSRWDFFDVPVPALKPSATGGTRDRTVLLSDVLAVLAYVGTTDNGAALASGVDYDTDLNANGMEDGIEYDRTPSTNPSTPWRSGGPNGSVTLQDALAALAQVGDNCAAPP